ncbi:unnamed protein product [Didymodactylos carnosus]|uniref:Uncharacterized protein n=1 Tax=Didymodactylos carnosus TaxID=1234261 RepID=A0A8S2HIU1_9BILA|nr:unnamed protein product [Didymodactylos carnosus]CAF3634889.1 unnamed protein product [Didymodactylos carnosus]
MDYIPNLPVTDRQALHSLRRRLDIVIKPADKNVGVVAIDVNVYEITEDPSILLRRTYMRTYTIVKAEHGHIPCVTVPGNVTPTLVPVCLTFDGINTSIYPGNPNHAVLSNYGGLRWKNVFAMYGIHQYSMGVVSAPNVAWGHTGMQIMSVGTRFSKVSFCSSAAYKNPLQVIIIELRSSIEVKRTQVKLFTSNQTLIQLFDGWQNVDTISFQTGGTTGFQLTVDNFCFVK